MINGKRHSVLVKLHGRINIVRDCNAFTESTGSIHAWKLSFPQTEVFSELKCDKTIGRLGGKRGKLEVTAALIG